MTVLALTGGVGGAKLALGLAKLLQPEELAFVVNTGDDFEHLGLHISPDVDTLVYTLAGLANPAASWGRDNETWRCMETLEQLGGETWFRLGDRDLGLHLHRRSLLQQGLSLTATTACSVGATPRRAASPPPAAPPGGSCGSRTAAPPRARRPLRAGVHVLRGFGGCAPEKTRRVLRGVHDAMAGEPSAS